MDSYEQPEYDALNAYFAAKNRYDEAVKHQCQGPEQGGPPWVPVEELRDAHVALVEIYRARYRLLDVYERSEFSRFHSTAALRGCGS